MAGVNETAERLLLQRIVADASRGERLVRVAAELLHKWGTRTANGDRITVDWGLPDEFGVYEPIFTVHFEDNLMDTERRATVERIRAAVKTLSWSDTGGSNDVSREAVWAILDEELA